MGVNLWNYLLLICGVLVIGLGVLCVGVGHLGVFGFCVITGCFVLVETALCVVYRKLYACE